MAENGPNSAGIPQESSLTAHEPEPRDIPASHDPPEREFNTLARLRLAPANSRKTTRSRNVADGDTSLVGHSATISASHALGSL